MYEIWDYESGSAVGDYRSFEDALAVIQHSVRFHGSHSLHTLGLFHIDAADATHVVARGDDLLRFLRATAR